MPAESRALLPGYVHEWAADAFSLRSWELRGIRPGYLISYCPRAMRDLADLLQGHTSGRALFWPWALRAVADAWEGK